MSLAISPSEQTEPGRDKGFQVSGRARISFCADGNGVSRLEDLYQCDPLRVMFPYLEAGEPPTAAVITTSGGLVGGDHIALEIQVGENADAAVHAQASEKIYRSAGAVSRSQVHLTVDPGAALEYLPQETILFDRARFSRETQIDLSGDARLLAGEILVLGRRAHGERFSGGSLRESWRVLRDGELCWSDCFDLGAPVGEIMAHPAGFNGAHVIATLVCATPFVQEIVDPVRQLLGQSCDDMRSGASLVKGLLLVRWLARSELTLRHAYAEVWCHLRHLVMDRPKVMPRLWHI